MTKERRIALLGSGTSRRNKMAILADCGPEVQWRWRGEPYKSRLLVSIDHPGTFEVCASFDEDVLPTYKSRDQ